VQAPEAPKRCRFPIEISRQTSKGFTVEAKRWIVERTRAWLDNARSLTRDYERLPENHEGMVYIVMIRLMLRRLEGTSINSSLLRIGLHY
jgi:transposase